MLVSDWREHLGRAVHLCIDMQRIFAPGGAWPAPWMERVLPNAVRLVAHAPRRTILTRFITPLAPADMPGMWQAYYEKWRHVTRGVMDPAMLDLVPALEAFVPSARVIDKTVFSAFVDGRLHVLLQRDHVDTLIVSGSETDVCVLASVLSAVDLGYRVVIARDAVCSSSDDSHDALIALYGDRFGVQIGLAPTEEILRHWRIDRQ